MCRVKEPFSWFFVSFLVLSSLTQPISYKLLFTTKHSESTMGSLGPICHLPHTKRSTKSMADQFQCGTHTVQTVLWSLSTGSICGQMIWPCCSRIRGGCLVEKNLYRQTALSTQTQAQSHTPETTDWTTQGRGPLCEMSVYEEAKKFPLQSLLHPKTRNPNHIQ